MLFRYPPDAEEIQAVDPFQYKVLAGLRFSGKFFAALGGGAFFSRPGVVVRPADLSWPAYLVPIPSISMSIAIFSPSRL